MRTAAAVAFGFLMATSAWAQVPPAYYFTLRVQAETPSDSVVTKATGALMRVISYRDTAKTPAPPGKRPPASGVYMVMVVVSLNSAKDSAVASVQIRNALSRVIASDSLRAPTASLDSSMTAMGTRLVTPFRWR